MCTFYSKQGHLYFIVSVLLFFVVFFLSFPAKGIYPACDRVHLILSFYMNLRIYIGDSSLSEFLRKTLQCIRNETF